MKTILFYTKLLFILFCILPLLSHANKVKNEGSITSEINSTSNLKTAAGNGTSATTPGVYQLQSYPGSNYVLFLDFDGMYKPSTNDVIDDSRYFPPSGLGDPKIQAIWAMVSEDYIPFDLNITTDSNIYIKAALAKRGRVVITSSTEIPGHGGQRFGEVYSITPGVVSSGYWNYDVLSIGNTVSHEIGHMMGLRHDGQIPGSGYYYGGNAVWGPIMGSSFNAYSTFCKGDYLNATETQPDLDVIASVNGFTYRPDLHGNTIANPTPIKVETGGLIKYEYNNGVIEKDTDKDVFFFNTLGGAVNLNINPATVCPNLDILATLYNEQGNVVGSSDDQYFLSATFNFNYLPAGKYYLIIDGTGRGNPLTDGYSDYGSVGYYFITGTIANSGETCTQPLWSSQANYNTNDRVQFNKVVYRASKPNINQRPDLNSGLFKAWRPEGICGALSKPKVAITSPSNNQTFVIHPFKPKAIDVTVDVNSMETRIDSVVYIVKDYNYNQTITKRRFSSKVFPFNISFTHIYSTKTEIIAQSYSNGVASLTDMVTIYIQRATVVPELTILTPSQNQQFIIDLANPGLIDVKVAITKYDCIIDSVVYKIQDLNGWVPSYRFFTKTQAPYDISFEPALFTNMVYATVYFNGGQTSFDADKSVGINVIENCQKVSIPTITQSNDGITFKWKDKKPGEKYILSYAEKGSMTPQFIEVPDDTIKLFYYSNDPIVPTVMVYSLYEFKVARVCTRGYSDFSDVFTYKIYDCGPSVEPEIGMMPNQTNISCLGRKVHFYYAGSGNAGATLWRINNGNVLSYDKDFYYTFDTPGQYEVRLTEYGARGCPETRKIDIMVYGSNQCCTDPTPTADFTYSPTNLNIPCIGNSAANINLNYSGPTPYPDLTWYINGVNYSRMNSINYTLNKTGENKITLLERNGSCIGERSINYQVGKVYTNEISAPDYACVGSVINLSVEPVSSSDIYTIWTLPNGMKRLTAKGPNNTIQVQITSALITKPVTAVNWDTQSGCYGDPVQKTIKGCYNPIRQGEEDVDYTEEDLLLPNPFTTSFKVTLSSAEKAQIEISNIHGVVLYSGEVVNNQELGQDLPSGIYIVKQTIGDIQKTTKLIKQ